MNPDGGKRFRVRRRDQRSHGATRRQPGDVDAFGVDATRLDHRVRHRGNHGRLAAVACLVVVLEPVPATRRIGVLRLCGVQHIEPLLARQGIHARARSEVIGILRAAVQRELRKHGC